VLTTVYGGDGADTFTVGQFFAAPRIELNVEPGDGFATVQTELGWASPGILSPTTLYGGAERTASSSTATVPNSVSKRGQAPIPSNCARCGS
jgi:hypothetical protein